MPYAKTKVREAIKKLGRYEVRKGPDGEDGLFLRKYNVRVATFSPNTAAVKEILKELCDLGHEGARP